MVRKPDKDIRMAMADSTTIDRVARMTENSIHPTLLFFEKDLDDHSAQLAVQKIHVEDSVGKQKEVSNLMHMRETNTLLSGGFP